MRVRLRNQKILGCPLALSPGRARGPSVARSAAWGRVHVSIPIGNQELQQHPTHPRTREPSRVSNSCKLSPVTCLSTESKSLDIFRKWLHEIPALHSTRQPPFSPFILQNKGDFFFALSSRVILLLKQCLHPPLNEAALWQPAMVDWFYKNDCGRETFWP